MFVMCIVRSSLFTRSCLVYFFFLKQMTAYEMRISDWSSDVCSSDLAKAFIADFFIIISATNRCLVDCALYVVLGHGLRLGGVDREAQTRVHVRIGHAHFRGDGDFAAELREHGGALLVLRALAMHDILEFAVTGHRARSCSVYG